MKEHKAGVFKEKYEIFIYQQSLLTSWLFGVF